MYEHVRSLPGCDGFDAKRRLKFVTGHTHCNVPHPHGHNGTGFMVAGQGMEDPHCLDTPDGSRYGVPVFDSTQTQPGLPVHSSGEAEFRATGN